MEMEEVKIVVLKDKFKEGAYDKGRGEIWWEGVSVDIDVVKDGIKSEKG